jgi:hypothetical protein
MRPELNKPSDVNSALFLPESLFLPERLSKAETQQ